MSDRNAGSRLNLIKPEYDTEFYKQRTSLFAHQLHNPLPINPEYNNENDLNDFNDTATIIEIKSALEIPKTIPSLKLKSQLQKNIFNKNNQIKSDSRNEKEVTIIAKDITKMDIPDFEKKYGNHDKEEDKKYRQEYLDAMTRKAEEKVKAFNEIETKKKQEKIRKKEIDFRIYAFDSNGVLFRKPIIPQFEDLNRVLEEEKQYEKRKLEDKERQLEQERLKALETNKKIKKKDVIQEQEEEEERERQKKIDLAKERERKRIKERSNFAPDFIIPKQDIKLNGILENTVTIDTIHYDTIYKQKWLNKQKSVESITYNKGGNTMEKYFVQTKEIPKKAEFCGSHYDLITPVPGVVLYEKNKPEKYCSAFIDQYNRTSIHDYSKMLNESMIYNNSMVKRGVVSMPLQQKDGSIGDSYEPQPYYGYKESIQSANNPLIQSANPITNQSRNETLIKKETDRHPLPPIIKSLKNSHSVENIDANYDPEKIRRIFNLPLNDLNPLNSRDLNSLPMNYNNNNKKIINKIKNTENYFNLSKKREKTYLPKRYDELDEVNSFNKDIVKNKEEWGINLAQYKRQPPFAEFHKNVGHKGELEQTIIQTKLPRERRLNRAIHHI